MQTRHPLRAALAAMCVPLVMIAVFGNAWFTEHVLREPGRGQLAQRLLATLAPFTWTFTPRQGRGAGTIWLAQWLGILVALAPPTVARPAYIGETVVTSPTTGPPSAPGP